MTWEEFALPGDEGRRRLDARQYNQTGGRSTEGEGSQPTLPGSYITQVLKLHRVLNEVLKLHRVLNEKRLAIGSVFFRFWGWSI
jgi:hypothetical protein